MGRRAGAITLFVAIAVATATPAHASPPPGFYGVVAQDELGVADFERMEAGRVGTLRATLAWSEVDPTPLPGDLQWEAFDRIVRQTARRGIRVLPTVYTVPGWVAELEGCETPGAGPCTITPPRSRLGLEAWRSFLAAAAARYGPGGLFWVLNPGVEEVPIEAWQIWNEPNAPGFYKPFPNPVFYADLVVAAATGLRSADPGAEVVLGGLFRNPSLGRGGISGVEFLRALYARPGFDAAFDGVALHPYGARMSRVRRSVRRMLSVVDEAGDDAETWITEIGWSSHGKPNPLNRGPRGQARRLAQAFRYFARERRRLRIRAVLWYAWQDVAAGEVRCQWCAASGLFTFGALDPKPAWDAFTLFTGGT
jgi:hypothetical protein